MFKCVGMLSLRFRSHGNLVGDGAGRREYNRFIDGWIQIDFYEGVGFGFKRQNVFKPECLLDGQGGLLGSFNFCFMSSKTVGLFNFYIVHSFSVQASALRG